MTEALTGRKIQGYGWKPSLPDPRDLVADVSELPVLLEVDPREEYMTAVYDQLRLGSCTANAVAAAIDADRIVSGLDPIFPSRLWIYALERLLEGSSLYQDTGAFGRDGFKAARRIGIVSEDIWPYSDDKHWWTRDPTTSDAWAMRQTIEHPYKAVRRGITTFKRVFSNKQTIAFGFSVFESFESQEVELSGVMPHPDPTRESQVGGHEVLGVGYLREMPFHCLCRNEWSTDWGIGGYFFMPWSVILDPELSGDFRTIYRPMLAN